MLKTIKLTPLLQSQIDRVLRAVELYPNEDDGPEPLEQEQRLLAEEVIREYARQVGLVRTRRPVKAALTPVIEVELRPTRSGTR